ncbi:amino acid/amide ABC transporter membrane protein 2, HAAT family [Arboricoccus pini]|uniref:Amino acid/amide ABC transporter membrane protein 2, HAAT family n=1 Tax=Arboricoccus pini TaxID=1963835 RepID=A0A212Q004_9PROT|nr:branched-chain amino acid ABC transporter permease [Arboricoccus pini]SNB52657.1 amino acid/amide ABC transporter membrane protein 2, HAAT family [Arboricoccus pini]
MHEGSVLMRSLIGVVVTILGLMALCVAPSFLNDYGRSVLVIFMINAILVMSYRLITTTGGWSFAHVAFMGLSAYTMALMTTATPPWSFWLALLAGPCVAGAVALALAFPVLRTRQHYFFLITFAASEAINQCFVQFDTITGGPNGIAFIPRPGSLLGLNLSEPARYYELVLCLAVVLGLILYLIDRSKIGAIMRAVAGNEDLSESIGINTQGFRILAFVVGAGIAGVAGVLFAAYNGIINPPDFGPGVMFKIVAAAIVGGTSTFYGPLLGLLCLTVLEEASRNQAELIPLLWGVTVVAVLLLSPGGLETLIDRRLRVQRSLLTRRRPGRGV